MRGRKTTPTALKRLHGNPGKRPLPRHEPRPPQVAPIAAPPHLDKEAAAEWDKMVTELSSLGMLSVLDLGLLAAWCGAFGDLIRAERELKRRGPVVKDRDKTYRRNPWFLVKYKAIEMMARIGSEFGFSPASRPRIAPSAGGAIGPAPCGDGEAPRESLDDYLARRPRPNLH